MADRTPAETLLAAADRLDALLAKATPGPWHADVTEIYGDATLPIRWVGETCRAGEELTDHPLDLAASELGQSDAAYIAAMSPTVGRALVALLRSVAGVAADGQPAGFNVERLLHEELALARAILGGDHD